MAGRVAVFGATGRTGRPLVRLALAEGYEVRALAREPSKLGTEHERLEVIRGDVLDASGVGETVAGTDAVLSVLGHAKASSKDVLTRGMRNILAAMKEHGAGRIVSLTGAGVRDSQDEPKLFDKAMVVLLRRLQGDLLRDSERQAEAIKGSGLEWVIVRGPMLTEGERKGEYRVGHVGKNSGSRISRTDVADFMLRQLSSDAHLGRMPMVSY